MRASIFEGFPCNEESLDVLHTASRRHIHKRRTTKVETDENNKK